MTDKLEPCVEEMHWHLTFHFPHSTGKPLTMPRGLRAIWPDGKQRPQTRFFMPFENRDWHHEAAQWATVRNRGGANIYFGTGLHSVAESTADAVAWQEWCYVDADDKPTFDRLKALTGIAEPNYLLETGGGRGHAYWKLDSPESDPERFRQAQKALITKYGTDPAIHDFARIMRLAGTINWPNVKKRKEGRVPDMVGGIM